MILARYGADGKCSERVLMEPSAGPKRELLRRSP